MLQAQSGGLHAAVQIMEAKAADHRAAGGEPKGKAQLAAGGAKGQHRSKAILRCFLHKQGGLRHRHKGQAEAGQHQGRQQLPIGRLHLHDGE